MKQERQSEKNSIQKVEKHLYDEIMYVTVQLSRVIKNKET